MADFCRQCSLDIFGEDFGDLAGLAGLGPTHFPGWGYAALCEGCGLILVNDYGECQQCQLLVGREGHNMRPSVIWLAED